MRGHVHFDIAQTAWTVATVAVGFHFLRMLGAFIANHGSPKLGTMVGGIATFNSN